MTISIHLKPGREKSLLRRHPWVFSGAIRSIDGNPNLGETVAVYTSSGDFLAWGAFSPRSQIAVRVWSFDPDDEISPKFFRHRLQTAFTAPARRSNVCRLVHAESDNLPGFVLDRYDDTLVAQISSAGAESWRETLTEIANELTGASRVYERSDLDVRQLEGLPQRVGSMIGDDPPEEIWIDEYGLRFSVDVVHGHKTGYYLDQRINRQRVAAYAKGCDILDCFCYTGGFSTCALAAGAQSVTAVDASSDALAQASKNISANDLPLDKVDFQEGDVFQLLRKYRDSRRDFDMIILDPPKFAQTTSQAPRAARGYKDINLLALKLLRPGGILATFSCSGGVSADLFQKIVAGAAQDAGVDAQILEHMQQASDHPIALHFPEGEYLKGLIIRRSK